MKNEPNQSKACKVLDKGMMRWRMGRKRNF